ncbi:MULTISPECIES: hypothetical protein [Paenibacillus]|uniref:hypothetical protein n=1 Tax=Paenibacillus TaxID=44249 RepID=UPI001BCEF069|nr:hypothetical protein [Paenibacillus woosongensis]
MRTSCIKNIPAATLPLTAPAWSTKAEKPDGEEKDEISKIYLIRARSMKTMVQMMSKKVESQK